MARDVIDAFFGDEDAYDRYTMARIEVMQDKSLSATEKARRTGIIKRFTTCIKRKHRNT